MPLLLAIVLASLAESAVSFSGAVAVIVKRELAETFAHRVLGFAVGALLGVTFFDVLPEAIAEVGAEAAFPWVVAGIFFFFILEKSILWYHYHQQSYHPHSYTYLLLIGDAVHNFVDGVALALSFLVSIPLGIATTVAILLHEVPQEIADFGLLIRGGFSRAKALVMNFLISLTTIGGALLAYALGEAIQGVLPYALALIGGNFLYLALSDLLPEIHEHRGGVHFVTQLGLMLLGAGIMYTFGLYFRE